MYPDACRARANVVKVDPPSCDALREFLDGATFAAFDHGPRRSIGIDLTSEAGAETVRILALTGVT